MLVKNIMDFEISQEFIEEQKVNSQNLRKRGPYKKGDRSKRQDEVYRLHFELGYTAHSLKDDEDASSHN